MSTSSPSSTPQPPQTSSSSRPSMTAGTLVYPPSDANDLRLERQGEILLRTNTLLHDMISSGLQDIQVAVATVRSSQDALREELAQVQQQLAQVHQRLPDISVLQGRQEGLEMELSDAFNQLRQLRERYCILSGDFPAAAGDVRGEDTEIPNRHAAVEDTVEDGPEHGNDHGDVAYTPSPSPLPLYTAASSSTNPSDWREVDPPPVYTCSEDNSDIPLLARMTHPPSPELHSRDSLSPSTTSPTISPDLPPPHPSLPGTEVILASSSGAAFRFPADAGDTSQLLNQWTLALQVHANIHKPYHF
ncbi:hypothetical protein D9757_004242 [Collybiopsis confluens]|uniref:Uncharacterized protein n=1 Tax=Collybiopsis confluens TaxID=2823264 RepID=A0A8H5HTX1_9AGAR|nr:hypothetical protein D9757_004242 [Collybiopsis confluens]